MPRRPHGLRRLGRVSGRKRPIRADDLFVDIAKHGSEAPVKQLREHGIDAAEIDRCVTRHKMDVLETPPEMDASEQGLKTALTLKSTCRPPSETRRAGDYGD